MSFVGLFKSIYLLFCGGAKSEHEPHPQPPPSQPHRPPAHDQPPQHNFPPTPHKPPQRPHSDPNGLNQQNPHYTSLRREANEAGDKMAACFKESHEAYERRDGARAKDLSNQGKAHQAKMESLNREASNWIFIENNKDSGPGEVDLHGLYVKEAIYQTDKAIQQAKQRGDHEIRLIVGKGLHSQGGAAKIKPAIEELMRKHQLGAELDQHNAGVLVVRINGQGGVGSDEITRRLGREEESCTIM